MVDDLHNSRYKICPNLRHLNIRAKGISDCDINGSRDIGLGLDEVFPKDTQNLCFIEGLTIRLISLEHNITKLMTERHI